MNPGPEAQFIRGTTNGLQVGFVNYPLETFTSTQSGALATIISECCEQARLEGLEPWVITRRAKVKPCDWKKIQLLEYPEVPSTGLGWRFQRLVRKVTGWRHLGQATYARRVVEAIRKTGLGEGAVVLLNDPETAILLRKEFPRAFLIHWFQNQLEASEKVRRTFRNCVDVVCACSAFTAGWIERYYGLAGGAAHVVYNAVDATHFRPATDEPGGGPVINFVGRTGIEKAPDLLLQACLQLARNGRVFSLQIIGSNHWDCYVEDEYQRELQRLAAELERLGIRVRWTGHIGREQLPEELRRAHIHVTPSRWEEPFGMTTLEAMACGLAVVASASGGTPEVVGESGLLFRRDSAEDLAEKLAWLLDHPRERRQMARNGRRRAETFPWKRAWQDLRTIAGRGAALKPAVVVS